MLFYHFFKLNSKLLVFLPYTVYLFLVLHSVDFTNYPMFNKIKRIRSVRVQKAVNWLHFQKQEYKTAGNKTVPNEAIMYYKLEFRKFLQQRAGRNYYSKWGVRLHYVESGPKDKELLLFVHGFPDFWFTWKHQILEFSKDYWTVAVDMRGYGDSEKSKKISFYKINLLVDDIKNLILSLGRDRFTLIAHDWGGVVAHYFIRLHPEMLDRYVLLNTVFHPKLGATFISDTKQLLKSWYILILQIPYYAEFFFMYDDLKNIEILYKDILLHEELEAYKFMFGSYDKIRPPINYYRANFKDWKKEKIPDAEKLNANRVPGLYIHGENDFALTEEMSFRKSFEDVKNIRFASVPNAGHFVHVHSPKIVNLIIRNFFDSTPTR